MDYQTLCQVLLLSVLDGILHSFYETLLEFSYYPLWLILIIVITLLQW